jgi:hypothetical protein
MAEIDDVEVEGGEKPKRPAPKLKLPKPKGGGGGGGGQMLGWVLALAAIGLCVFLFMKLTTLEKKLAGAGPVPKGSPEGQLAARQQEEGGEAGIEDWTREASKVKYKLEKPIISKTSDKHAVKLEMALEIESFYRQAEWDAYTYQMEQYKEELQTWYDFQAGKIGPDGKPIKKKKKAKSAEAALPDAPGMGGDDGLYIMAGGNRYAVEIINAEGGEKAPEISEAEEPKRPMTVMELQLAEKIDEVREAIGGAVITFTAADLNTTTGRDNFKKAVVEALNTVLERHYGTVVEVIISDLVTD